MKNICTLLLILYTLSSLGQEKLDGQYCAEYPSGDFYKCLEFKGNEFSYEGGGHLGIGSYGSGTYEQIDGILILNYNQTEPFDLSYHKLKFWTNKKTLVDLKVNVTDLDGKKVRGANIFVNETKKGVIADTLGFGHLVLEKENQNIELIISYLGYLQEKIQLRQDYNYEIDVYLKEGSMPTPILNQMDTLQIIQNNKDSFEELMKNSGVRVWNKT